MITADRVSKFRTNAFMTKEKLIWWEKSVEYAFIAQMVARDAFVWAAPLGGNTETALSDTILNWNGNVLLLEFKRDSGSFDSEHEKYVFNKKDSTSQGRKICFEDAKKQLEVMDGASAHGLIYGELVDKQLMLRAVHYWDVAQFAVSALDWCDAHGVKTEVLDAYCERLVGMRHSETKGGRASGSSGSFVLGVGKNNKSFFVEMEEYINLRLEYKKELNPTKKRSVDHGYSSPGMP